MKVKQQFNFKKLAARMFALPTCIIFLIVNHAAANNFDNEHFNDENHFSNVENFGTTIIGTVADENGLPLQGITVTNKNTGESVSTGVDGKFSIEVSGPGDKLVFTSATYQTQEVAAGGNKTITIKLVTSIKGLDDVVVIGYGSVKRTSITGAVTTVSSKKLNELPVANIESALQGRVAGLSVVNNGGPGAAPIVTIRGISSIGYGSSPLYVVDGFPVGGIGNIDGRDIESVEVLKDASAAAIYGSRATNGVILVTTKRGNSKDGKLQVNLDSYVGIQSSWKKLDLLNTDQYVKYATALGTLPPRLTPAQFNQPVYVGSPKTYAQTNTDWQDEYFVKNAIITQHNISVSGNNGPSRFFASAGYFQQDGITQAVNYKRINFRINSEHKISNVFSFGQTLYVVSGNQRYDNAGNRTRLVNAIRMQPYIPVYDPTTLGGFRGPNNSIDGSDPVNPVEVSIIGENYYKSTRLFGTAYLAINLAKGLQFKSIAGLDHTNDYNTGFFPINNDNGTINSGISTISNSRTVTNSFLFTQQLTYDTRFNKHHINLLAVYEQQSQKADNNFITGNQATNDIRTLTGATNVVSNANLQENFLLSYVGRINYDFAGKYLVSATFRRDGLSIWAPGKKYANFPSASVGWRIDQESFMKALPKVSELKLRAGYGVTGLNGLVLGNYTWQSLVAANDATYGFGNSTPIPGIGSYFNTLGNTSLEWEKTKQLNIGLDLGLFRNKLTFTAEYFKRQTDNLLLNVATPASFGFNTNGVLANVGKMKNTGFEFQVGYNKSEGLFRWNASANISFIENKVLKLSTSNAAITAGQDADFTLGNDPTKTDEGNSIQYFYGWLVDRIFTDAADVAKSPTQVDGKTAAGDIKFKDINGDNVINDEDRVNLGSYLPKFTYAFNYGANYKQFDLSLFFQGVQGNKIFNGTRVISEGMVRLFNSSTEVLKAWTPTNTNTNIPRAISGDPNQNARVSDRWIEDGSYLRLKNIIIGYNVSDAVLKSMFKGVVTKFRLYVSSQNLLTFTKYKGYDPEVGAKNGTLTNGIDYSQYPAARSFQFGLQVGF